nr:RluA family pseudouridine synthase [Pelagibacterales bacterium]
MNQEETIDSNNELFEHYQFKADKGQEPLRVDKFLINRIENASRNKIQSAAKNGFIFVNQKSVKSNYKVKPGDITKVMFSHPPYENLLIAEEMPLNIIYEDKSLLVINKPSGIVVHPGHGNYNGTLLNGLIHHFKNLPSNEDGRPGLVHRIDKDTSGLLVIAKTEFSMTNLAKQFYLKSSKRKYHALVWGSVQNDEGTINENLARDPKNRLIMSVPEDKELGKNAITHYKVLERFNYVTLLECQLETGRTHQIRAHMKFIGHPIFNDKRYGGDKILKGTIFNKYKQFVQNCFKILPRQALH